MTRRTFALPKIFLRSDIERNWERSQAILQVGELAFCAKSDGRIEIKVGDGVHTYIELPELSMHNMPDDTYLYARLDERRSAKYALHLISPDTKKKWEEDAEDAEDVDWSGLDTIL